MYTWYVMKQNEKEKAISYFITALDYTTLKDDMYYCNFRIGECYMEIVQLYSILQRKLYEGIKYLNKAIEFSTTKKQTFKCKMIIGSCFTVLVFQLLLLKIDGKRKCY